MSVYYLSLGWLLPEKCRFVGTIPGFLDISLFYFFTHGKTPFSDYSADSSEVESFFFRDFPEIIL
jgi:hypothetical protein